MPTAVVATGQGSLDSRLSSFTLAGRQRDNSAVICATGTSPPGVMELPAQSGVPCCTTGRRIPGDIVLLLTVPRGKRGTSALSGPLPDAGSPGSMRKVVCEMRGGYLCFWLQGWLDQSCLHVRISPARLLHGSLQIPRGKRLAAED